MSMRNDANDREELLRTSVMAGKVAFQKPGPEINRRTVVFSVGL